MPKIAQNCTYNTYVKRILETKRGIEILLRIKTKTGSKLIRFKVAWMLLVPYVAAR